MWLKGDTVNGNVVKISFPKGQSLVGYGLGYDYISKTTDGGWHWNQLPPLPDVYPGFDEIISPSRISFPGNLDTGYLTVTCIKKLSESEIERHSSYFKTTDGGQTWVLNEEGLYNDDFNPYLVDFPQNPSVGYMVGGGAKVFKTTNGGATWDTVFQTPEGYPNVYDICFPENDQVGYVLNDTMIHKTTDGGQTWRTFGLGQDTVFLRCHFLDNLVGFISGTGTTGASFYYTPGFVMKTTDGLLGIAEENWVDCEPRLFEISTPAVFSQKLVLRYQAREPGEISASLYDASGSLIESLVPVYTAQGSGSLNFNPGLPSGVYFVRLEFASTGGNQNKTVRTVKVR